MVTLMTISPNCKKLDHVSCTMSFGNSGRDKCECRCHLSKNTESLQEEKDKRGITRQDELRAETVP
jgi:hypothetical protein